MIMKTNIFSLKALSFYFLFCILNTAHVLAQVGIGTTIPDVSSVLDVSSVTQGMLTPRMTTAQRIAIASPANGLIAYDTNMNSFYYYDSAAVLWIKLNGAKDGRLMYKLIKSSDVLSTVLASELTAGGGAKYLLDTGTLYEINGTIMVDFPIELNNAYVVGLDSGEDKLIKASGDLFTGTTGGSIRVLTLAALGGNVFNLAGGGTQNLIFRDCVIGNSANVGLIDNFGLVFVSIIQFSGNANGIVYKNIDKLLLSNMGWFGNNSGTYEKLEGTFGLVGKQGGFSEVNGTSVGFDVSSNPVITNSAVMESTVFTGTLSSGFYVKRYTTGSYAGFNFNDSWTVRCSGVPTEGDFVATGDMNFDYPVGSGASTTLSGTAVKLLGNTTSNSLYRFSTDGGVNNRLKYLGTKSRYFKVSSSLSFQASADATVYIFYIAKNGTIINQSKVYTRSNSTLDIIAIPIVATVSLSKNDYIEVYVQRFSGTGNALTVTLSLTVD